MTTNRVLADRYELGDVIGRGGMATVFAARDLRLGREVAVKELRLDLASDTTFQERFRREAQAAAGLNHPNIVAVFDTGEEHDDRSGAEVPFIVMERIQGRTLREILADGRALLPSKAIEFAIGILDALAYSHRAGIVHRDIKPANVMLTSTGQVKVMDFGIARAVADTTSTMTQTASVIGTAQYLSPEQARGELVDARSDIYSAGTVLYELLTGRPPFVGESPVSVAYQHVRETPTPPSELDAEVTPAMDAVVLKALAKDTADRYQHASDMADDLRRILAGDPVTATAPAFPAAESTTVLPAATTPAGATAAETDGPRNRWLWPLITGLLLLALAAATAFAFLAPRKVEVPNVVGARQDVAVATLSGKGLRPKVTATQGPNDATVGMVTKETPVGGTAVDANSEVALTVNSGPAKLVLPAGILGKDVNAVTATLKASGFTVQATPATAEPREAVANQVIAVSPAEGTAVTPDQTITLTYATGKATVPNLRGLSRADATNQAKAAGFTNLVWKERASNSPLDTVVDTDPTPFSVLAKNAPLTLYYATAMATPTVTVTSTGAAPQVTTTVPTTAPRPPRTSAPVTTAPPTTQEPQPPVTTTQPPSAAPTQAPSTPPQTTSPVPTPSSTG